MIAERSCVTVTWISLLLSSELLTSGVDNKHIVRLSVLVPVNRLRGLTSSHLVSHPAPIRPLPLTPTKTYDHLRGSRIYHGKEWKYWVVKGQTNSSIHPLIYYIQWSNINYNQTTMIPFNTKRSRIMIKRVIYLQYATVLCPSNKQTSPSRFSHHLGIIKIWVGSRASRFSVAVRSLRSMCM